MPVYGYIIYLHLLAIVLGVHTAANDDATLMGPAMQMTFAVVVTMACATDARVRRKPILHIIQFIMLFTWPVTATAYVIWSRRWRGILWAMLWCISLFLCYALPAMFLFMLRIAGDMSN